MFRQVLLLLSLSSSAVASPIAITDITGNSLLGFDRIEVGGALYDARFVGGSFRDVFTVPINTPPNEVAQRRVLYDFSTREAAISASFDLLAAISLYPEWDSHAAGLRPFGIMTNPGAWVFYTPYSPSGTFDYSDTMSIETATAIDFAGVGDGAFGGTRLGISPLDRMDSDHHPHEIWVDWSTSATAVPVPASIWLFAPAIALLGAGARAWH